MGVGRRAVFVLALSLILFPGVSAGPITCLESIGSGGGGTVPPPPECVPPDAPENIAATYDTATDVLTITWTAPSGMSAPSSYNVYRDGNRIANTATLSVDDDLTGFEGQHTYYVTAVWPTREGDASVTVLFQRTVVPFPSIPPSCEVASIALWSSVPFVYYSIHEECIL